MQLGGVERNCAPPADPRFRYRLGPVATLLIMRILSVAVDRWAAPRASIAGERRPVDRCLARPQRIRNPPTLWISCIFCQQEVDLKLDKHRRMAKNTLELIVLPVFRQVLPADPALGLAVCRVPTLACGSDNFKTLSGKLRAASMPSGLLLGERYPSEPWPWVFGFYSLDPDQLSTAVRRYTSARRLTAE